VLLRQHEGAEVDHDLIPVTTVLIRPQVVHNFTAQKTIVEVVFPVLTLSRSRYVVAVARGLLSLALGSGGGQG